MKKYIKVILVIVIAVIGFEMWGATKAEAHMNSQGNYNYYSGKRVQSSSYNRRGVRYNRRQYAQNNLYRNVGYGTDRRSASKIRNTRQVNYVAMRYTPRQTMMRPSTNQAQTMNVSIQNMSYQPGNINVAVDTTVIWTNNDSVAHTVTADNGRFDSGVLNPGQSFRMMFSAPGTVAYHCSIHPFMHGSISVSTVASAQSVSQPTTSVMSPVQPSYSQSLNRPIATTTPYVMGNSYSAANMVSYDGVLGSAQARSSMYGSPVYAASYPTNDTYNYSGAAVQDGGNTTVIVIIIP